PDVGDDRPPVPRRYLLRIVRHGSKPIRDHVEKVSQRRVSQPVNVVRRRPPVPALHDHSVPVPQPRVARRAINVVPLPSPFQYFLGGGKGHLVSRIPVDHPAIEIGVGAQLPARYRPGLQRPGRAHVRIKIAHAQRLEPRLVVHVQPASRRQPQPQQQCGCAAQFPPPLNTAHPKLHALPIPPGNAASSPGQSAGRPLQCTGKTGPAWRMRNAANGTAGGTAWATRSAPASRTTPKAPRTISSPRRSPPGTPARSCTACPRN